MTRFFIYLLFLFVAVSAVAQVNVSGTVVDKESNEPLTGASVIVKGADGKIKEFTTSKGDGGFAMSWLGNMENELLLNIMPHRKWEWHISGEHYRNELTSDQFKNVFLLDTKLIYKLNKRLELSASLSNIFNQRTYNYTTYNQLTSFESQRWLRGRELLISISLRK